MRRFVKLTSREMWNGDHAGAYSVIATHGQVCERVLAQRDFASPPEALQLLGEEALDFDSGMDSIRQTLRAGSLGDQVGCNIGCDSGLTMMFCRLSHPPVTKIPILAGQISTGRLEFENLRNNFPDSDSKSMAPCVKARLSQNRDVRPFV